MHGVQKKTFSSGFWFPIVIIIVLESSSNMTTSTYLASIPPQKADSVLIPDEFICPITQEIMVDPIMSRYGQSYERQAIVEWLASGTNACPLTRQPLNLQNLVTHHSLRMRIQEWHKVNGLVMEKRTKKKKTMTTTKPTLHGTYYSQDDDDDESSYGSDTHPAVTAAFFNLPPSRRGAEEGNTDRTSDDDENLTAIRVERLGVDSVANSLWLNSDADRPQQWQQGQERPSRWRRWIRRH